MSSGKMGGPAKLLAARTAEQRKQMSLSLIELIYDSSIEPRLWQSFVEIISEACGGAAAAAVVTLGEFGTTSHAVGHGLDPKLSDTLDRHLRIGLPWLRSPKLLGFGEFVLGSDYLPDEEVAETEFFREYMQPQQLAPEGPIIYTISASPGQAPFSLAMIYRRESCRPFSPADLELCDSLVPHLRRAYGIHRRLQGEREQRRALAEVVDRFPMGVLLTDASGRCVSVNASAKRILDMNDGMRLDEDMPTVDDQRQNERFQAAIASAAADAARAPGNEPRVIAVERFSGAPPFTVAVVPLLQAGDDVRGEDAVAAVFIADPEAGATSLPVLEALYGLTPAESSLVGQLVTGRSLDEIAERRGIRTSTARSYLKNAYRKTETSSQRDLVRLVLTGISRIQNAPLGSKA